MKKKLAPANHNIIFSQSVMHTSAISLILLKRHPIWTGTGEAMSVHRAQQTEVTAWPTSTSTWILCCRTRISDIPSSIKKTIMLKGVHLNSIQDLLPCKVTS